MMMVDEGYRLPFKLNPERVKSLKESEGAERCLFFLSSTFELSVQIGFSCQHTAERLPPLCSLATVIRVV